MRASVYIASVLLEDDEDDFNPKADTLRLGTKPIGWVVALPPTIETNGRHYPRQRRWLNSRTGDFRQYLGDATIFKRLSTTKQWPELEAIPIYSDPRKYGLAALDPRSVLRENEEDDDFDPKAEVLKHFAPSDAKFAFTAANTNKKFIVKLDWNHGYSGKDEPHVQFWDADYASAADPDGYRTPGTYAATTLLSVQDGAGLDIYGSEPAWIVDGASMDKVRAWIKEVWPQWHHILQRRIDSDDVALRNVRF